MWGRISDDLRKQPPTQKDWREELVMDWLENNLPRDVAEDLTDYAARCRGYLNEHPGLLRPGTELAMDTGELARPGAADDLIEAGRDYLEATEDLYREYEG